MTEVLGEDAKEKYVERKQASADRCPRELGTAVKTGEVLYHHEVTNQYIWGKF
jgi:glutamine synthetase